MVSKRELGCLVIALSLISLTLPAQEGPPATDIYLSSIGSSEGSATLSKPIRLTDRVGYDNQPSFSKDGNSIFYTSIRDGQADIWRIDLDSKRASAVTETPEREYSPTPIPGERALSVIRVEEDEKQRLWRFPLDGGEPSLLLADVAPVGYHAWGAPGRLALFVLGEPHTLQRVDGIGESAGKARVVAENIGRSLHKVPGRESVSFVQKGEGTWHIVELPFDKGEASRLAPTLSEREDYVWSPGGEMWMGDGSKLYRWQGEAWSEVADFADQGLKEITRLAISPDGKSLAMVANRSE